MLGLQGLKGRFLRVGRIESYGSHYDLDATGQSPPGREVQQCYKISIPFGTRYPTWVQGTSSSKQHEHTCNAPTTKRHNFPLDYSASRTKTPAVLRTLIDKCAQDVMMLTRYTIQLRATPCTSIEFARHEFKAPCTVGLQAHT